MRLLYTIGIYFYSFIIHLLAPFNSKAKKWLKGRENLFAQIKESNIDDKVIWIHAASVGEFEQARPLIEQIKQNDPHKKILITFFSPSAYELRKDYPLADYIFYLPLDTPKNAKRLINMIQPQMVFFVKYEFWFNFIAELNHQQIPLFLISGIFRPSQLFFKRYGGWFRKHLPMFKQLFVQDNDSANLLESIKLNNFSITGDTRFDRVNNITQNPKEYADIQNFTSDSFTILCGSTWMVDEELLLKYYKNTKHNIKLIIAPHEVDNEHIEKLQSIFKEHRPILWSSINEQQSTKESNVLIVDSVGHLMHLYQYADIAYIGGGFGVGIHNILEAACFGKPIVFGPNYQKFKEARDLINLAGGFSINNIESLSVQFNKLVSDKEYLTSTSDICKSYISLNIGATQKIYTHCFLQAETV